MAMIPFPLSELLKYDDDLAKFYKSLQEVLHVDSKECQEQRTQQDASIWIYGGAEYGYLLQRNGENTYLLLEITVESGRWESYFALHPKGVLLVIHDKWFNNWPTLFPLIRMAHAANHPQIGGDPDPKYLEHLMAEALLHLDRNKFFTDHIAGLEPLYKNKG